MPGLTNYYSLIFIFFKTHLKSILQGYPEAEGKHVIILERIDLHLRIVPAKLATPSCLFVISQKEATECDV